MITQPTVLILGAGASHHLDYPLGRNLARDIVMHLRKREGEARSRLKDLGCEDADIDAFIEGLTASGTSSVDEFLENRPEFIEIGRLAIAQELIPREQLNILADLTAREDNWYHHLFKDMDTQFDSFGDNKLSIITFNYDRSLDQYLYTVLANKYGRKESEIVEQLRKIEIVHVYGQLCKLPWEDDDGRVYKPNFDNEELRKAAKGIKIIHEQRQEASAFQEAHKLIENANKIVFLGFQYDDTNMKRLGNEWNKGSRQSIGSCHGFTPRESRSISAKYNGHPYMPGQDITDGFVNREEALQFLRKYVSLSQ